MSTPNRSFADRLFALGYQIAFWFYRRPDAKAVKQSRPVDALDWFTSSEGAPRRWDDVFGVPSAAQRQQADPTIR